MKNLYSIFIAFIVIFLSVAGCKKDDNSSSTTKNSFKYNNVEYNLSKGFLENYGQVSSGGAYNIDLSLISSGFTIHESNGEIDSLSGIGEALYFELYTSDPTKLAVRDYAYDVSQTMADGTFDMGFVGVQYNASNDSGTLDFINGGKLTVKSNGSVYELSFTGTTANGKSITMTYKGSLNYYNYGKKKSVTAFPENQKHRLFN
jgi:hypothetical protein